VSIDSRPLVSPVSPAAGDDGQGWRLNQLRNRPRPTVSVVLGTRNRRRFLEATIRSIRENVVALPFEIIVVDGGSTDGSLRWLPSQKDIIAVVQHNGGQWRGMELARRSWGYFMNLGFKCASGKYICMVSDDCLLAPGAIEAGVDHLEGLRDSGMKVGAGAFYFRDWPDEQQYHVQLTLGGRMMVNHGLFLREAIIDVGWADEERYAFYHADSDLCLKLWQDGYEVVECPDSYVEHYSHADRESRGSRSAGERADWQAYIDKWTPILSDGSDLNMGSQVVKVRSDRSQVVQGFPRIDVARRRLGEDLRACARLGRGVARRVRHT
jgi:GT2 family glycosyltransferase